MFNRFSEKNSDGIQALLACLSSAISLGAVQCRNKFRVFKWFQA
jgi:hypothetical protein